MIEYLPLVLTGLGLAASIVYYANIIQNANKARQRDVVFQRASTYTMEWTTQYATVSNMEDWSTVEEFHQKYGLKNNPTAFAQWLYVRNAFNLAGLLLKEKHVDAELIFQLYPPNAIINLWEKHEPLIMSARDGFNHPRYYEPFEFLYNEAKKRYPEITRYKIEGIQN